MHTPCDNFVFVLTVTVTALSPVGISESSELSGDHASMFII
jgi:hypothetical protein